MDGARPNSVYSLVKRPAAMWPDHEAIIASERRPMTYRVLLDHLDDLRGRFHAMGLGSSSRLGIILPNGPESAVAFLAAASSCVAAPLNPRLSIGARI